MSDWRRRIGQVLAVSAATFLLLDSVKAQSYDERAIEWIRDGSAITQWDLVVEQYAELFLKGTRYQGRFQINLPPRAGFANFYIIDRKALAQTFPAAQCGCLQVAAIEGIVCDATFLHQFSSAMSLPTEAISEEEKELNRLYRTFLMSWVLGHELGHLVLNAVSPGRNASLASPGVLDIETKWGQASEAEADLFYLSKLAHRQGLQISAFMGLSQFVTRLYAELALDQQPKQVADLIAKGEHPYFTTVIDVTVPAQTTKHPPLLLRALSLADQLIEFYPSMVDDSGYYARVRNRLDVDLNKPAISACNSSLLNHENMEPEKPSFTAVGDAELADRLAAIGAYALAEQRLIRWHDGVFGGGYADIIADLYVELSRLGAAERPSAKTRKKLASLYARNRAQIDDDMSLLIAYAVAVGRSAEVGKERAKLEPILRSLSAKFEGPNATWKPSDRLFGTFVISMFEIEALAYGLDDQNVRDRIEKVGGYLGARHLVTLLRDFLRSWKQIGDRSYKAGSFERVFNDLNIYDMADQTGLPIDAANLGIAAARDMEAHETGKFNWQAFWHDRVGRTLLGLGHHERSLPFFQYAAQQRERQLELVKKEAPNQLGPAASQVTIAWNQVGHAQIIGQHPADALVSLQRADAAIRLDGNASKIDRSTLDQNLAQAHLMVGNKQEALSHAQAALSVRREINADDSAIADSLSMVAAAQYLNDQKDDARQTLTQWRELFTRNNDFDRSIRSLMIPIAGKNVPLSTILGISLPEPSRMEDVINNSSFFGNPPVLGDKAL